MDPIGNTSGKYGGSIKEAGGSMGAFGASRENAYFIEQDQKKMETFRKKLDEDKKTQQTQQQPKEKQ